MYPEDVVAPMREEAVAIGCQELRTAEEVNRALKASKGTALVLVNSICGCAAANARPGLQLAIAHGDQRPDHLFTVFAGQDKEATQAARAYFTGYPPSSPSMGLLKDGKLVGMLQRVDIEGHSAQEVAMQLIELFNEHCQAG
jgi:putative YphP/YqiW family bacilliredoxin